MDCSICLDKLNTKTIKMLPCNHLFHKKCINEWLKNSIQCPLCKYFLENEFKIQFCKSNNKFFKNTKIIFYDSFIKIGDFEYIDLKKIQKIMHFKNIIEIVYMNNSYYIYSTKLNDILNILVDKTKKINNI